MNGRSAGRAARWWQRLEERPQLAVTLVAVLGILARLAFLALEPASELRGDEPSWLALADREVLRLRRPFSPFKSGLIFYPPLYPYFLAAMARVFGAFGAARFVQALFGGTFAAAVAALGMRGFGVRIGLVAGLAMALYPELLWFSAHYWSETLFLALFWWAVERTTAAAARSAARLAFAGGLLWGLAALTRETALFMAPLAVVYLALTATPARRWRAPLLFVLGLVLAVAPWTLRNRMVFGAFVPISTFGALNLWQGNSPLSREDLYVVSDSVEGPIAQYQLAKAEAWKAIAARQPFWIFQKIRREALPFWSCCSEAVLHFERGAYAETSRAAPVAVFWIIASSYGILLLGFLMGARDFLRAPVGRFLGALLLAYFGMHVAAYSVDRFRLPLLPILALAASGAAVSGWRPAHRWQSWAATLIVAALLVYSFWSCLEQ